MTDGNAAEHGAQASHVLSLCDRTGNMVRPWAEAGHVGIAVDTAHSGVGVEDVGAGSIIFVEADVRDYEPPAVEYSATFAFPPCTHLAVSGARWFQEKGLTALAEAIEIVGACHETLTALDCPWMLENPKSTLSTHWRKPDYTFDPFEYANYTEADESYSKETWLWTGGGFHMPVTDGVAESDADDRIHRMAPGEDRSAKRSETPMGFARAVFLAHQEPERYARADSGVEQARLVTDGGEELQGPVYRRIARALGRGGKALILALIAGFVAGLLSRLFAVDPFGPIVITYTTTYVLAYLAAVLVERSESDECGTPQDLAE